MDLTVHPVALAENGGQMVDPYSQADIDGMFYIIGLPIWMKPWERLLLAANEYIEVPVGYVGDIGVRSSAARLGLMSPKTTARPGWRGYLTMEVVNTSLCTIRIRPGYGMWEMNFVPALDEEPYQGRYQDQGAGPQPPKALAELEK